MRRHIKITESQWRHFVGKPLTEEHHAVRDTELWDKVEKTAEYLIQNSDTLYRSYNAGIYPRMPEGLIRLDFRNDEHCAYNPKYDIVSVGLELIRDCAETNDVRKLASLIYHEMGHQTNVTKSGKAASEINKDFIHPYWLSLDHDLYEHSVSTLYIFYTRELKARCFEATMYLKQSKELPSLEKYYSNRCTDITRMREFIALLEKTAQEGKDGKNSSLITGLASEMNNRRLFSTHVPDNPSFQSQAKMVLGWFHRQFDWFKKRVDKIYYDFKSGQVQESKEITVSKQENDVKYPFEIINDYICEWKHVADEVERLSPKVSKELIVGLNNVGYEDDGEGNLVKSISGHYHLTARNGLVCKLSVSAYQRYFKTQEKVNEFVQRQKFTPDECWTSFRSPKLAIMVFQTYNVGTDRKFKKEKFIEAVQHEINHVFEQLNRGEMYKETPFYTFSRLGVNRKDEPTRMLANLLYASAQEEQQSFANGLSAVMTDMENPFPKKEDLHETDCMKWLNRLRAAIIYFEQNENDDEINSLVRQYTNHNVSWIINYGKRQYERFNKLVADVIYRQREINSKTCGFHCDFSADSLTEGYSIPTKWHWWCI